VSLPLFESAGPVRALAFDATGDRLAAATDSGAVGVWQTAPGRWLHGQPIEGPPGLGGLAFHPDGSRLAGVTRGRVQVWDVPSGQTVVTLRGAEQRPHDNGFNPRVARSPDGRRLAASQWNRTVSVWTGAEAE
jgi:WD40 repeat protein